MHSISPYISFNGKCREAMTFYQTCLGGQLELLDMAGSPIKQFRQGDNDKIFHSSLTVDGLPLVMGSDMLDRNGYVYGNNIALAMGCSSEVEIQNLFEKLSADGKVLQPLKNEFWGAIFGSFEDRYGIKWQLNYNKR